MENASLLAILRRTLLGGLDDGFSLIIGQARFRTRAANNHDPVWVMSIALNFHIVTCAQVEKLDNPLA
jgi:hypothetical protein